MALIAVASASAIAADGSRHPPYTIGAEDVINVTVALKEVLFGDTQANAVVQSGDVLTIEPLATLPVYLMGKVTTPGLYRVRKDCAGVVEALALAGGTLEDAALTNVTITHLLGSSETVNLAPDILEGKRECSFKLQSGDMVLVPEETARVAVLGYVNAPGFYPLRNGRELMLSDALGLAGGADTKLGEIGSVVVIRTENGR